MRADARLAELGLAPSREKAKALIMEGRVFLGPARVDKAGAAVPADCMLTVRQRAVPFVSRGGLKLEKAVSKYGLSLRDRTAADIGASTGGFTDCMLRGGARRVYAIDVGYGQLAWKLRNDPRVVVMERVNARNMEPDWFEEAPDFAAIDVSFISVRLILPSLYRCLEDGAEAVVLVKPQFEAGRGSVGKNGVVRDRDTHFRVLRDTAEFALQTGFTLRHADYSPIKGPKGNIEFLLVLAKAGAANCGAELSGMRHVVDMAHEELE